MYKSLQEIFDRVATKLLEQNEKCLSSIRFDECLYFGDNGKRCAIGWLMPESFANLHFVMDNEEVGSIIEYEEFRELFSEELLNCRDDVDFDLEVFLSGLQRIHDVGPVHEWKEKLKELAKYWGLQWNLS